MSNNSARKRAWYKFARLANNLRFKLKPIKEFLGKDPNKVKIWVSLCNWWPKDLYKISDDNFKLEVDC